MRKQVYPEYYLNERRQALAERIFNLIVDFEHETNRAIDTITFRQVEPLVGPPLISTDSPSGFFGRNSEITITLKEVNHE